MPLILYTVCAWLIHALLVFLYLPFFTDTSSLIFRLVHIVEIGIVMYIAFYIYFKKYKSKPSPSSLSIVLTTLFAIDLIFFRFLNPGITIFDIGHFIAAFTVVSISHFLSHD